jgi:hypothetical protein
VIKTFDNYNNKKKQNQYQDNDLADIKEEEDSILGS